jgi:transposase InsO family protein
MEVYAKNCLTPISFIRLKMFEKNEWMLDYNHERPHESLNYKAPADLLETAFC